MSLISPTKPAIRPPQPLVFARLALETDRPELLELLRARLTAVSPWLEFDAATANMTLDNYFATANPTVFVAEGAGRQLVGYWLATFEEYSSTAGYAICKDEIFVRPGSAAGEATAELDSAFETWVRQLKPEPLEVLIGMDVDLAVADVARLQHAGGH